MKFSYLSPLLLAAALLAVTTSSFAQSSGDEAAIRQVLDATQLAFDKRDINEFSSHFMPSPSLYYLVGAPDGMVIVIRGYNNLIKMLGDRLKELTNEAPSLHTVAQYTATINEESAWVTYIQHDEMADGNKVSVCQLSVLEKQRTTWKIVAQTSQAYSEGKLIDVK